MNKHEIEAIVKRASELLPNAYCPYSKFPVSAALLTENGEIFGGGNHST
jgi:cytidine deaminase